MSTEAGSAAGGRLRGHKILSAVGIIFALGACGAVPVEASPNDDDASPPISTSPTDTASASETADDEAEPVVDAELTDEEIWAANYDEARDAYAAEVAAALGLAKVRAPASSIPLASCQLIDKDLPIGSRTSKAAEALDLRRAPTAAEIFDVISAATTYVCPALDERHETQVANYERAESQAAKKALRRKRRDEARQAAALESPPPVSVYYANCTEVENAGAAPIYSGQPGYSTDLDRDGDGVACEQ